MASDLSTTELLQQLDPAHGRLRELVRGRDGASMAVRPAGGGWSVLENVRHLLFAEQLHLGRFVPGPRRWSELGFTPATMRLQRALPALLSPSSASGRAGLGEPEVLDVADVLAEWERVHAEVRVVLVPRLAEGDAEVRKQLERNSRHLRAHSRVIERLLR